MSLTRPAALSLAMQASMISVSFEPWMSWVCMKSVPISSVFHDAQSESAC
jgi:hypothetical protein